MWGVYDERKTDNEAKDRPTESEKARHRLHGIVVSFLRNAEQAKMPKYAKFVRYFTYFVGMTLTVCTVIVLAEIVMLLFP